MSQLVARELPRQPQFDFFLLQAQDWICRVRWFAQQEQILYLLGEACWPHKPLMSLIMTEQNWANNHDCCKMKRKTFFMLVKKDLSRTNNSNGVLSFLRGVMDYLFTSSESWWLNVRLCGCVLCSLSKCCHDVGQHFSTIRVMIRQECYAIQSLRDMSLGF